MTAYTIRLPGNLYVITAPSGAGKSSLVSSLLNQDQRLSLSISHTTRQPRGQEKNGKEYWFTDTNHFKEMIERQLFIEWAQVHDNYYGTSRKGIQDALEQGNDIVLEIDWQGALQIKNIFPYAVLIFILPPSWDELKNRLIKRGEDAAESIENRLANAKLEIKQAKKFDFVIINASFDTALSELSSIIQTQRLRYEAQKKTHQQIFKQLGIIE